MSVLNKQITINPEAYKQRWDNEMNPSLQDAFNETLSNFSENEVDKSYNDEMHQYLRNDQGDVYYFDDFKYIYPKEIGKSPSVLVLNNSREFGKFCCVKYNGVSIIVENYNTNNIVDISSYFMTDASRKFIATDYLKDNMGEFLLQVSGNNQACVEKLHLGSKITVVKENGNLVTYDINGNVLDSVRSNPSGNVSFYKDVETNVDYYGLLDKTYYIINNIEAENQTPLM